MTEENYKPGQLRKTPERRAAEQKAITEAARIYSKLRIFKFKAWNKKRRVVHGYVRAKTREGALKGLWEKEYTLISLEEIQLEPPKSQPFSLKWVAIQEALAVFTKQLSVMYKAGLPLAKTIGILFIQTENKTLKEALSKVYIDLIKGASLNASLARHPEIFSHDYVSMIAAAEKAGTIHKVLDKMAQLAEKNVKLIQKVKSAMTYPLVVLTCAFLVNFAVFKWILPNFLEIFDQINMKLPLVTTMLLAVVKFMQNPYFWSVSIFGAIFLLVSAWHLLQVEGFKRFIDSIILKSAFVGKIQQRVTFIRIFRLFASMMSSGVHIVEILECIAEASNNAIYEEAFLRMIDKVKKGETLAKCFMDEKELFPLIAIHMVKVGDETGEAELTFNLLADFYEAELDYTLNNMASVIEPLMIGGMGVLVGFIVIAIFVPIYNLIGSLS